MSGVLDEIAERYDPSRPDLQFDHWLTVLAGERILAAMAGRSVLELGCGSGVMTKLLTQRGLMVWAVDGSPVAIARAAARSGLIYPALQCALLEEYEPKRTFSDIILASVLEHVADPVALLRHASDWLGARGRIHVVVPNSSSLHRRIGVALGILSHTRDLAESDLALGHRRTYTATRVLEDLAAAGLRAGPLRGIFLKLAPNHEQRGLDEDRVRAIDAVAVTLPPELCAQFYVWATRCA